MERMKFVSMMALLFITVVLMAFSTLGLPSAFANDIQNQIAALEQEDADIQKGYDDLNADIGNYNIVEKQLEADINNNEAKRDPLENKLSAMSSENGSLEREIAAYNAECARTFYVDRGEGPAYERCVSRKNSLDRKIASYDARNAQLQNEINAFNEANEKLKQRVEDQKRALVSLNDREKQLQAREEAWLQKYNLLINSVAFQQLIRAAGASEDCKNINFEELKYWDPRVRTENFEKAHRCLQRIWDGAN